MDDTQAAALREESEFGNSISMNKTLPLKFVDVHEGSPAPPSA
jgi:hypothetical protein